MNSRLGKMRQQRAAIADHLRWLDDEIAAEMKAATPPGSGVGEVAPARTTPPAETRPAAAPFPLGHEPDAKAIHHEVRRGCFIYAAVAIGVVLILLVVIYLKYRTGSGS